MTSDALMDELQSFLDMGGPGPGLSPRPGGRNPGDGDAPSPAAASMQPFTEKRKIDLSPGDDEIGGYSLNSPAKMPKLESVKEEPGLAGQRVRRPSTNLPPTYHPPPTTNLSGGLVKSEDGVAAATMGSGTLLSGLPFKTEPGEEAEVFGAGGEARPEPTATEVQDKQKSHATAARIRIALEASGLSGNLTNEDLQTLKRLNEIAKSTNLTQVQKSGEASHLLKNNPNVSRLLLKLRTEKNAAGLGLGPRPGPVRGPEPAPGPGMEPAYPAMQGTGAGTPGNAGYGKFYGVSGGQAYRGQGPPGGQQWSGQDQQAFYRGQMVQGGRGQMVLGNGEVLPMVGPAGMRMHPDMMGQGGLVGSVGYGAAVGYGGAMVPMRPGSHGMYPNCMPGPMDSRMGPEGGAPGPRVGGPVEGNRTVYMNRQTGLMYQSDHPGMQSMGPRPPAYSGNYMPAGFHPGMAAMRPADPTMGGPRPGSPYSGMVPGMAQRGGVYGSPHGAPGAHGGFEGFTEGRVRWEENRDGAMLAGTPKVSPHPMPPVCESQLCARLSGVTTSGAPSAGGPSSELASRLMAKPQYEQPGYGAMARGLQGLQESTESLFDEINNSQFLHNANNFVGGKFNDFTAEKVGGGMWKESQNANDLRSGWLRRLTTALETSANIPSPEAATRMAQAIEEKAFRSSETEAEYTNNIAVQLARIFSRAKEAPPPSRPDSTSWPEEAARPPSSTQPDFGAPGGHFHSDATLHCFQVAKACLQWQIPWQGHWPIGSRDV
jgi:hypothetical protein